MTECDFCHFDGARTIRWNYRDPTQGYRRRLSVPNGEIPEDERVGFFRGLELSLPPAALEKIETLLISERSLSLLASQTAQRIDAAKNPRIDQIFADVEAQIVARAAEIGIEHVLGATLLSKATLPSINPVVTGLAATHQPKTHRNAHGTALGQYADRRMAVCQALDPLEWKTYSSQRLFDEAVGQALPVGPAYDVYRPVPMAVASRSTAALYCESCGNDILVCDECAYHDRHVCTECADCFCASCLQWSKLGTMQLVKPCPECATRDEQEVPPPKTELELLLEAADALLTRCPPKGPLYILKQTTPRILVVSDGVHFDYSTKLATQKLASKDVFVVGTQFDYSGWPGDRPRPSASRFAVWEKSFDVTRADHWNEISSAFGPFEAIIFNNPLIGYYFHRIHAKGTNSKYETWDAIHSLADAAPPYSPSRTDSCFFAREHAQEHGAVYEFKGAQSAVNGEAIAWQKMYSPLSDPKGDYRRPYHYPGEIYRGRTFSYNVEFKRVGTETFGFQWFIMAAYFRLGRETLQGGGTIEVNAPSVLDSTLTDIGFTYQGSFRGSPYGQDFAVELTHYGWHPSWPMFDRLEMECGPQDGDVRDMRRYVGR